MKPIASVSAKDFPSVYADLGINTDDVGCIMLDTAPIMVSSIIDADDLYYAQDKENHKYIDGIISEDTPHVTLLYGLLNNFLPKEEPSWKPYVDIVLEGWNITHLGIDSVGSFESNYDNEAYYCIVAHIIPTPQLVEGNARLQLLPHINTFLNYNPHITLAYIKQDTQKLSDYIDELNNELTLKKIAVKGINYGE